MNIDAIKEEIEKDSEISVNLDAESLRISSLQSKWISLLTTAAQQLRSEQIRHAKVERNRTLYYMGKASDEEYKAAPLQLKVLKQDLPTYLNADDQFAESKTRVNDATIAVNMIELFLKDLSQRSFNIRNSIEYQKFKAGL